MTNLEKLRALSRLKRYERNETMTDAVWEALGPLLGVADEASVLSEDRVEGSNRLNGALYCLEALDLRWVE